MAFSSVQAAIPTPPLNQQGVAYIRVDLAERFPDYDLILDCLSGSRAIKEKGLTYLPMPDPSNLEASNISRYDSYLQRAVFYNVTQRTALGLQGQIFLRPPAVKAPPALENVVTDSNGAGISLEQLARDAEWMVASCGRAGLFIDYPPTKEIATKAQLQNGNIRPTITVYGPKNVINWRTKIVGSKQVLSLVVLAELYEVEDDGFETKQAIQYRELRLTDDNIYSVQLWRAPDIAGSNFEKFESAYFPRDGKGNTLDQIPFTFIGSKNNEPTIDPPPLLDMANINIAHYCNSADYEEMIYVVGQPMLVLSGLTKEWFEEVLGGKVPFGSRSGLALPKDATAELIQIEINVAAKEGMEQKERQMVALGAKLVEQKTVQRTATESSSDTASEESVLSAIAKNVSSAFKWALEWCAVFLNASEEGIEFQLNSDFELARLSNEEIQGVILCWQDEGISWSEMRAILRKAGRATLPDDEAKAEIEKDQTAAIERAALQIGAETAAANANGDSPADDSVGN